MSDDTIEELWKSCGIDCKTDDASACRKDGDSFCYECAYYTILCNRFRKMRKGYRNLSGPYLFPKRPSGNTFKRMLGLKKCADSRECYKCREDITHKPLMIAAVEELGTRIVSLCLGCAHKICFSDIVTTVTKSASKQ